MILDCPVSAAKAWHSRTWPFYHRKTGNFSKMLMSVPILDVVLSNISHQRFQRTVCFFFGCKVLGLGWLRGGSLPEDGTWDPAIFRCRFVAWLGRQLQCRASGGRQEPQVRGFTQTNPMVRGALHGNNSTAKDHRQYQHAPFATSRCRGTKCAAFTLCFPRAPRTRTRPAMSWLPGCGIGALIIWAAS